MTFQYESPGIENGVNMADQNLPYYHLVSIPKGSLRIKVYLSILEVIHSE